MPWPAAGTVLLLLVRCWSRTITSGINAPVLHIRTLFTEGHWRKPFVQAVQIQALTGA